MHSDRPTPVAFGPSPSASIHFPAVMPAYLGCGSMNLYALAYEAARRTVEAENRRAWNRRFGASCN